MTAAAELPEASPESLPRWRGFNLQQMFIKGSRGTVPFAEEDFRLISQLGFNFVRLPMDYRLWIENEDWEKIDESAFANIDQAIAYGKAYEIHVCLNFHRAPGYTVARPAEPRDLWTDAEAQRVCAKHWAYFARRYKGIPNRRLSFNLMNEPSDVDSGTYSRVVKILVDAIRAEDPNRLIIADGLDFGVQPCEELIPLKVAQATRGYQPFGLTHYKASWVNGQGWPVPTWPAIGENGQKQDRQWLWDHYVVQWEAVKERHVGVMVGEWGVYNKTRHDVALRWMEDCLVNYRRADIGWALWSFRGSFGVLDSGREDVEYEDFQGHKLDRKMLDLLQKY